MVVFVVAAGLVLGAMVATERHEAQERETRWQERAHAIRSAVLEAHEDQREALQREAEEAREQRRRAVEWHLERTDALRAAILDGEWDRLGGLERKLTLAGERLEAAMAAADEAVRRMRAHPARPEEARCPPGHRGLYTERGEGCMRCIRPDCVTPLPTPLELH